METLDNSKNEDQNEKRLFKKSEANYRVYLSAKVWREVNSRINAEQSWSQQFGSASCVPGPLTRGITLYYYFFLKKKINFPPVFRAIKSYEVHSLPNTISVHSMYPTMTGATAVN